MTRCTCTDPFACGHYGDCPMRPKPEPARDLARDLATVTAERDELRWWSGW